MKGLTNKQLERQDYVDNAIYQLIQSVSPSDNDIDWNIEIIGDIRNVIREWIVERMKVSTEQDFYPYIEDEHGCQRDAD